MDRQDRSPSLPPILGGQLGLGLSGEARPQRFRVAIAGAVRKESLPKDIFAFLKGFLFYCQRRFRGALRLLWRTSASGFIFSSELKSYVQGRLYRRKGQLAFPLAHASLLGISFSLLIFTSGFGEFLYQQTNAFTLGEGVAIVADQPSVATEESKLLQTRAETYTVLEGDTLYSIASQFLGVTPDALAYANGIGDPFHYKLQPGDELTIPPVEGLTYTIKVGDTIELIARKYQTEPMDIVEFNYLFSPYNLAVDQELIIPYVPSSGGFLGGVATPTGSCGPLSLSWPAASHSIVGGYGCYYSRTHDRYYCHLAIDLAADYGDPLYAAADGTVVAAGSFPGQCLSFGPACNRGYGGYVFINIGSGYQIRYGHISKPLVGIGQEVKQGQVVALAGATGYAYGPHLHLELLCNGKKINPLPYLK